MPAGRPLEPAGNGRPRWMTAHREAARRPWTEPGVQADSSVARLWPALMPPGQGVTLHRVRNSAENGVDRSTRSVVRVGPQVAVGVETGLDGADRLPCRISSLAWP